MTKVDSNNKSIAILMTCHNRRDKTISCLNSLFHCKLPSGFYIDVFLVDDSSTDGTGEAVMKAYPSVNVISGNGKLYWNRGMCLAWEIASRTNEFEYYFWLNDDTLLEYHALENMLDTSERMYNKTLIVGTTCELNNIDNLTYGGYTFKEGLINPTDNPIACDFFNGNIVLIPKHVYNQVGMLDSFFQHALGDFDYGLRAAKLGVQAYVASGIMGRCDEHESLPVWCNPEVPFKRRWTAFRTPLGNNPEEFFVFTKRHKGIFRAIIPYITNHIRVVFPEFWK